MQKKLSAIIGLLLTVVMFVTFSVGTLEAVAASSESFDTYLADYLLTDEYAQSYINRDFKIPYRKYVEDRRNSLIYTDMLEAWEILTFDAKLADKTGKCVAYYETILYDTIYGGLDGNSELNDLTSAVASAKAGTMKTLMEYSEEVINFELKDIKKGSELYNTLVKEFVACKALKDAFENIGDLKDQLDKCKDLYEAVEKVSKVEALVENQEQIKKIVTDIGNSTANPALKLACARITVIMDDVIPDKIIAGVFASESTIGEAVDNSFKAVWDAILVDIAGAKLTIAVKAGQKSGKLAAGMLFSTDKDVEHVYAMDALYDIEDITLNLVKKYQSQYQSSPTQANARLYTEAFKQLIKIYIEGVDYSKTYAEITNEQGLINQLFKKFESDDYKKFINLLDNMRLTYEDYLNYIDVCVYNNYLANVPNETVKKKVKVAKKATNVTDADITSYFNTYKEVDSLYTNRVVKEEWILTEDYTTYGTLTVEADIDLNGYTLTVDNVIHKSGEILFHNGTLKIDGDYLNATPSVDSGKKEYYDTAHGKLNMVWDNDYMLVGGDFITNNYFDYSTMSMGTIEVKGDLLDYTYYNGGFWRAEDENKVILSGTGNQTIHFENSEAHFNDLEIKNSNTRTITIDGYCEVDGITTSDKSNLKITSKNGTAAFGTLQSTNMTVTGNFELGSGTTTLSNSSITVNGDLTISDDIDMDSCTIYVTGMLDHDNGEILFHNGTLKIDGDYLNATPSVDSGKKEYYDTAHGNLNMVWDNDYMLVGGDFITNNYFDYSTMSMGTIEVKGDLLDYTYYNGGFWRTEDKNKVILSGTGNQTIHFENSEAHFNNLEIKNSNTRTITIDGYYCVNGVTTSDKSNLKITSKNGTAAFGTLQSTNMTVTGNFELGSGTTILSNSNITVNGNLTISDDIDMDSCTIYVTGMLDHDNGEILFHNGTLKIDGDYLNATPSVDSGKKEYYDTAHGNLNMVWDNDYMLVGGDFITNNYFDYSTMSMGTIEVKGDLLDYTYYNGGFWRAEGENKVILSGTGNQTVHFENDYAHFNDLEIKNANKRTIKLTGEFHANNIIIDGAVTINSSNKNATISNVTLKEGSNLTLTGNLNGITSVNKATFTSDTTSVTVNANTIKAVKNGRANITVSDNNDSSEITINIEEPFELGDVNCDGEVNIADAVLLQKWLLSVPNTRLSDWELGDLCDDKRLDVFDLCLLRQKLINS